MALSPESYRWLCEGALEVAGCVTVAASADLPAVTAAFGCDPESESPVTFAQMSGEGDPSMLSLQAWLGQSGNSSVMVEQDGFQGSRPEVLRPVSKASAAGLAASIFWNVNELVIFSAARKGKIVCSVELLGCDPAELPRARHDTDSGV